MAWSRKSRHERGLGTKWDKIRAAILARDCGLCQCPTCKAADRTTQANEVDHILPRARGGTDDPSNLRAVNDACHKRLTLEQQGKTYSPRRATGIDGWPR